MNKLTPNLRLFLAECCMKAKYVGQFSSDDYYAIARFCEFNNFDDKMAQGEHLKACFFKIQRLYINSSVANMIINNRPIDDQRMMYYYYKCNYNATQISMRLFMSPATLNRLRKDILLEVQNALFYQLSPDDIFKRFKLISLINLIDYRLTYITNSVADDADNFDKLFIAHLVELRGKYMALLAHMDKYLNAPDNEFSCVAYKLNHPNDSNSLIAAAINKSISFVSQKLKEYSAHAESLVF